MLKTSIRVLTILFLSFFLYGNIYFWTDENGTKHFSNIAPALNETFEESKESHAVLKKIKSNKKQRYKVLKVYDGDTIQVSGLDLTFKIRLVGIDSPEIGYKGQKSQPFSQKAKKYLTSLLNHKKIAIKSYGTGGYNRQLVEIFLDDQNINLKMLQVGLAQVYAGKHPKNFDSKVYKKAEQKAKQAKKGMWVQGFSYKSPGQWRKEHPRK
jgi:micrococcal nuclease